MRIKPTTSSDSSNTIPITYLDTDGTLAANSDTKVPSQKAAKTYVDTSLLNPSISKIFLDTNPTVGAHTDGKLYWDAANKCMAIEEAGDVTLQVGQEDHRLVYNNTGSRIANGVAVYTNGVYAGGTNDTVSIAKAKADSATTSFVLGLCTQDIDHASYGLVTLRGNVNDMDTQKIDAAYIISQGILYHSRIGGLTGNAYTVEVVNTGAGGLHYHETASDITIDLGGVASTRAQVVALFTATPSAIVTTRVITAGNVIVAAPVVLANGKVVAEGDVLYLHPDIDGVLTTTVPTTPDLEIRVGRLITLNTYGVNNGRINVRINQAYRIQDLVDTTITAPAVDDALVYNGTSWVNASSYNVTIGAGKTLDASAGTLTLANNQISGDKVEGGTINSITINTLESTNVTSPTINAGKDGTSGVLKLYSEQGAVDYTASVKPNATMTENADFFLPAAKPAATYFMVMTNAGIMAFDSSTYLSLVGNQSVDGIKTFTSFPITPSASPTTAYQVANKSYVDSVAVGLTPKDACRLATAAALPACTYSGNPNFTLTGDAFGLLSIDSVDVVATNRVLIKNQVDAKQNGIYTVTTIGDGGTAFVLTRAADYNETAEVGKGTFTYITAGSTNAGYQFIQTTTTPTLDTNDLVFVTLYAPLADTLDTVTDRGATTTNVLTMGGVINTGPVTESGIKNIVFGDTPYTVLATDRHIYGKTVGGAINVLLPPATGSGRIISFNKRDISTNIMTITADTTGIPDTINGSATKALENIYDSLTIQDCAANEWSNVIRSADVASNTIRVSASGRADYKTIGDAITYLNTLSTTDGIRLVVDGGSYDIDATITVNATMPITIEGSGISSTILNSAAGLLNSNMFVLQSAMAFTQLGFAGTDAWAAGTNASFVKITSDSLYCELKDITMDKCKRGIEVTGNSDIFVFDFIISNATVAGIEMNSVGANDLDAEIGNFESCAIGIHLLKSSAGSVFLNLLRFMNVAGNIGILYVPTTFIYSSMTIGSCEYNNIATFFSGFDFTLARDADIEVINSIGEEDKSPHAKINLVGNTTVTALASNTWTKATFVNTSSYACKWTVANNRLTYQSRHIRDIMMWVSGSTYISSNGTFNLQFAIVKNNNAAATIYGQTQITTDQNARRFQFSTVVYLDDVGLNDYYELWVRNITDGTDPVIADLNWLAKST